MLHLLFPFTQTDTIFNKYISGIFLFHIFIQQKTYDNPGSTQKKNTVKHLSGYQRRNSNTE